MCSKRRTKWGGGIRKKSTNYEKYSLVIVNQMRAFCNVINTSGGRRKVYQFNTQRSRNSPVSSNTSSNLDHVQIERLCGVLWKQNVLNKGPAEKRGEDDLSRPPILNREPNSRYQHLKRKKGGGCIREIQEDLLPLTVLLLATDGDSTTATGASEKQEKPIEYLQDVRHFLEITTENNIHGSFSISMFLAEPRMTVNLYKTVLHMI